MITFRDLELSEFRPDWKAVEAGQLDDFRFESRGVGRATPWKTTDTLRRKLSLPVVVEGIDGIAGIRRFLDRRRGRQIAVWQPSYIGEHTLVDDVAQGTDEITLAGHQFATKWALGNQYRYIALVTRAGKLEPYSVLSVSSVTDDDVLTLDRGLDSDLVAAETVVCPLLLARLAEDHHTIEYLSAELATARLDYIECPTEYPAADAASVADTLEFGTRPVFLYLITDGTTTLRLADYGVDITAAGETWEAADISGGELVSTLDMLGDSVTVTLRSDDPDLPLLDYLDPYNFRNYEVSIYLADLDEITLLDVNAPEHRGTVESVEDAGQGALRIEVSSLFRLNERSFPRLQMQRQSNIDVYSPEGGANIASFTTNTTIAVIQNTSPPFVEAAAFGDKATAESDPNWFALGRVTVGDEVRVCTGQDGDRLYLNQPFKRAEVTDAIAAVAGDDKRINTWIGKFNQQANFLGFTFLPQRNPQLKQLELPKQKAGKK